MRAHGAASATWFEALLLCWADGSTHTESNKLYHKDKHRHRPHLFPRQRPTAKSRHDQAALAASAEARGATHRARPRSPSRRRKSLLLLKLEWSAALKTSTRDGYNAQGVNLTCYPPSPPRRLRIAFFCSRRCATSSLNSTRPKQMYIHIHIHTHTHTYIYIYMYLSM